MSSQLKLEAVTKFFGREEAPVMQNLTFEVAAGEIVSVVGPSGCGKSTLLRIVAGLDREHQGEVRVDNKAITAPDRAVGLVFQEPRLLPWLNVEANVSFGLPSDLPKATGKQQVKELLDRVGLSDKGKLLPRQLSGGMAQRVALARALAAEPGVLLLDEPFSALDAFTRIRLQELLLEIWQRTRQTLLLVTHDIDEAVYLSDRVIVLSERPSKLHRIVKVPVERPRDRRDPLLARLRGELLEELHLVGKAVAL